MKLIIFFLLTILSTVLAAPSPVTRATQHQLFTEYLRTLPRSSQRSFSHGYDPVFTPMITPMPSEEPMESLEPTELMESPGPEDPTGSKTMEWFPEESPTFTDEPSPSDEVPFTAEPESEPMFPLEGLTGDPCTADFDCAPPRVCVSSAGACPAGAPCMCAPMTMTTCMSSEECVTGEVCATDGTFEPQCLSSTFVLINGDIYEVGTEML